MSVIARDADEEGLLNLARCWKAGGLSFPVHPGIGRQLNHALVAAHEDPVPFARSTSPNAPSLVDLIRAEYEREHPHVTGAGT